MTLNNERNRQKLLEIIHEKIDRFSWCQENHIMAKNMLNKLLWRTNFYREYKKYIELDYEYRINRLIYMESFNTIINTYKGLLYNDIISIMNFRLKWLYNEPLHFGSSSNNIEEDLLQLKVEDKKISDFFKRVLTQLIIYDINKCDVGKIPAVLLIECIGNKKLNNVICFIKEKERSIHHNTIFVNDLKNLKYSDFEEFKHGFSSSNEIDIFLKILYEYVEWRITDDLIYNPSSYIFLLKKSSEKFISVKSYNFDLPTYIKNLYKKRYDVILMVKCDVVILENAFYNLSLPNEYYKAIELLHQSSTFNSIIDLIESSTNNIKDIIQEETTS